MIDAMVVRGFSARTQQSYPGAVSALARHYRRSPEQISIEDLRRYFVYLVRERGLSDASCRLYLNGIRFLYVQVLGATRFDVPVAHPKRVRRIPELLTRAEVGRLVGGVANVKHRMQLLTCYGCGLRVSELVALKVRHVDGERRLLHIAQGPSRQDSCHLDRIYNLRGREVTTWPDTERSSRSEQWLGSCPRRALLWRRSLGSLGFRSRRWSAGAHRLWRSRNRNGAGRRLRGSRR
jgi:integrase